MKTTLKKLSICPCGFPVLKDEITVGTEYAVMPGVQQDCILVCGGCKKHIHFRGIYVCGRNGARGGFLPPEIFDLPANALEPKPQPEEGDDSVPLPTASRLKA